jgi:protein TonB
VPGPLNLLPEELSRPKRTGPEEVIPVPREALPDFDSPAQLMPNDFWSNLKQFLVERPVKITERSDVPFTKASFGSGIKENLRFFLSAPPASKAPINKRLEVDWGGSFGSFGDRIKEFFSPSKPPALPPGIKPVQVKDIWSKNENFGWVQILSIAAHVCIIALLVLPFIFFGGQRTKAISKVDVTPLDISPYLNKLPAGQKPAGGGGGGGEHSTIVASKGRAPRFAMEQFAKPTVVFKNPNPKLPMEATLLGPPDLKIQNNNMPNMGDPLAASVTNSNGTGGGSGIGSGNGGGIGSGNGAGLGPGEGGGTGGGMFRAGMNGVGLPACFYSPQPPYSDEARKAKYSGTVLVDAIVTVDGRVNPLRVVKSPGLGLDDSVITTLKTWRCKPAIGPGGRPVPVSVPFEVTFRLY